MDTDLWYMARLSFWPHIGRAAKRTNRCHFDLQCTCSIGCSYTAVPAVYVQPTLQLHCSYTAYTLHFGLGGLDSRSFKQCLPSCLYILLCLVRHFQVQDATIAALGTAEPPSRRVQMDRQTDGHYQAHYLPASLSYAVDKNTRIKKYP